MSVSLKLGTASWREGGTERRTLVAPLPSAPDRLVDLNRLEQLRLARLGEGRAEELAEVLVPASLRRVLESGPRALQRLRTTLAYAEKWVQRGDLPDFLAQPVGAVRLLPCLPRPALLRRGDGTHLDRLAVQGPGGTLGVPPQPTLAAIGLHRGGAATGWCLALENGPGAVLGGWMVFEQPDEEALQLSCGAHHRRVPMDAWAGLELPALRPAEVVLLPAPRLRPLPGLVPGSDFSVATGFETLGLKLGADIPHATVQ
ncbi:MAG TPA: hypothetical protein VN436_06635 [Holophaga sp.]|nr:hypothetical protein [Holophaga sp.]